MNDNKKHSKIAIKLPEYLNGRLSSRAIHRIDRWLQNTPGADEELKAWKRIQKTVVSQPVVEPSQKVWSRIQSSIDTDKRSGWEWVRPVLRSSFITVFILCFLWLLIRPGYALQWSVQTTEAQQFDIYRAPAGSQEFILLASIDAQNAIQEYRYIDSRVVPGKAYIYRVEGKGVEGLSAISQPMTSDPLTALPGQLAVVLSSLLLSFIIIQYGRTALDRSPNSEVPAAF